MVSLSLIATVIGLVVAFLICICFFSCLHICSDPKNIRRIVTTAFKVTSMVFAGLVTVVIFSVTVATYMDQRTFKTLH